MEDRAPNAPKVIRNPVAPPEYFFAITGSDIGIKNNISVIPAKINPSITERTIDKIILPQVKANKIKEDEAISPKIVTRMTLFLIISESFGTRIVPAPWEIQNNAKTKLEEPKEVPVSWSKNGKNPANDWDEPPRKILQMAVRIIIFSFKIFLKVVTKDDESDDGSSSISNKLNLW